MNLHAIVKYSLFFFSRLFVVGGGFRGQVRALNSGRVRRSRVQAGFGLQFKARVDRVEKSSFKYGKIWKLFVHF